MRAGDGKVNAGIDQQLLELRVSKLFWMSVAHWRNLPWSALTGTGGAAA